LFILGQTGSQISAIPDGNVQHTSLRPTKPSTQWTQGWSVKLTIQPHLVSSWQIQQSYTLTPPYALMECTWTISPYSTLYFILQYFTLCWTRQCFPNHLTAFTVQYNQAI